jgi:succinate dehydrogenase/fumarate reductase flavoprotein subunit
VMQSSLSRTESRGFFFRPDFQEQNQALDHSYSCAWYDEKLDEVNAGLWTWPEIAARFRVQAAGTKAEEIVCDDRR